VAIAAGVAVNDEGQTTGSMHGSIGDVDGDGWMDLLVTDLRYGTLYRNLGTGIFEDITRKSGVAHTFTGKGQWGANFFDFDNDGDTDIFATNGTAEELVLQYPLLLKNDGDGNYSDIGKEMNPYFSEKRSGRASVVIDYDNDGDLDILVSHIDLKASPTLLRNDIGNKNHWLGLHLIGANGPASSIGAKITLVSGNTTQVKINQWATSYLSYNDPRLLFGINKNEKINKLEIKWPDGIVETFFDIKPDQYITIKEGTGIK